MNENNNQNLNQMELKIKALSINESFARATVAGFCLQLNPSIDELTDIKTAVSEAVTNSIVHAYPNSNDKDCMDIVIKAIILNNSTITIEISDFGVGIKNLEEAKKPFYTTKPDQERSGMGFTVMESFMDNVEVSNLPTGGLKVLLTKKIKSQESQKIRNIN